MAEKININGFEMDREVYNTFVKKYQGARSGDPFFVKRRLYFRGDEAKTKSQSLYDVYKDRIYMEITDHNFTSRGLPEIFLEDNLLKGSTTFNETFNPGADSIITSRKLSEQEMGDFWICASQGYYNQSYSNVAPTSVVNLEAMERSIDEDLKGIDNLPQNYCIAGGFVGLSLLLTCAPHNLIVKSEKLIEASFNTLIQKGSAEIGKYGANSREREELVQFADKLRFMKQSYGLIIQNQKLLNKQNEEVFQM